MIEFRCRQPETLRALEFREFAGDLCAQILKKSPTWVSRTDVPWETVRTEERNHRTEAEKTFATSDRVNDYLLDKMDQWYRDVCLMEQPFVKDPTRLVGQVWEGLLHRLGDSIEIRRFSHFGLDSKQ